jgi:hypothetical protein
MSDFPPKIVRAVIPNDERPPKYLVDGDGNIPQLEHEYGHGDTFEGTLSQLGRLAAGRTLSVDFALQPQTPDEIRYLAKPLCNDIELRNGYKWLSLHPGTTR